MNRHRPLLAVALTALLLGLAACTGTTGGAPILANPVPAAPSVPPRTAPPAAVADPLPVVLPRDDGPHDRLTEWWYYTGHLRADDGSRYGFEFVIFRAERGLFPTSWVSHLAVTDETGDRFLYSQRLEVGPTVDHSPRDDAGVPLGFDLSIAGADPSRPETAGRPPWAMSGSERQRHAARAARARRSVAGWFTRRPRARPGSGGHEAGGPPRPRRLDRFRPGRRLVLLLADGDDRDGPSRSRWSLARGRGIGMVRPPVGRLHLGRRRRLGLVRRQPRRRHRPDALARPRRRRLLPADLRDGRRARRDGPAPRSGRLPGRGHRPLGQPDHRRRLSSGLDDPDPSARISRSPSSRRSRRRNWTPAPPPGSSTGRARRWSGRHGAGSRWVARGTWS